MDNWYKDQYILLDVFMRESIEGETEAVFLCCSRGCPVCPANAI